MQRLAKVALNQRNHQHNLPHPKPLAARTRWSRRCALAVKLCSTKMAKLRELLLQTSMMVCAYLCLFVGIIVELVVVVVYHWRCRYVVVPMCDGVVPLTKTF